MPCGLLTAAVSTCPARSHSCLGLSDELSIVRRTSCSLGVNDVKSVPIDTTVLLSFLRPSESGTVEVAICRDGAFRLPARFGTVTVEYPTLFQLV